MQPSIISLVLLGVTLGLASPSVKLERGDCPAFWFRFRGRCYNYMPAHMTWAKAELHCVSMNANLVSIHSPEENNFVKDLIDNFDQSQKPTWIGISDLHEENGWVWSDGCRVSFVQWYDGQPDNRGGNEHCGEIAWGGRPKWNDRSCFDSWPSVCASRKPVC